MSESLNPELLSPGGGPKWWEWLFAPFKYVAGEKSLFLGLIAILFAGFVGSLSRSHFDGVLDMHTGVPAPLEIFLVGGVLNWLVLSLMLFAFGKLISQTAFRPLDLFGTQAMARWPMVLAAFFALLPGYQRVTALLPGVVSGGRLQAPPGDLAAFIVTGIVSVIAIVWMIALMYQSYRICCNVGGGSAVVTFTAGLVLAEVVTKVAFHFLLGSPALPAPGSQPFARPVNPDLALVEKANDYVDLLVKGEYKEASERWLEPSERAPRAHMLKSSWERLVKQVGPFQRRVSNRAEEQGEHQFIYVTCQFEKHRMEVRVEFDKAGGIVGEVMRPVPPFHSHGRTIPATPPVVTPPRAVVEKANRYVDLLAKGKYDKARGDFAPSLKEMLPASELKSQWEGMVKQFGAFRRRLGYRGEEPGAVVVTCQFARRNVDVKVPFNFSQQITGVGFEPAPATTPSPAVIGKANHFVDSLAAGRYQVAGQDYPAVRQGALTASQLKAAWDKALKRLGPFQRRVGNRSEMQQEFQVVYVTCQFAKGRLNVKVVFDPSDQMTGFWFEPAPAATPLSRVERANTFVDLLAKGDYAAAAKDFDPAMQAALPPDKLQSAWGQVTAQVGAFEERLQVRTTKAQGHFVVIVNCQFARKRLGVKVVFNGAQISGLWFVPASE